MDVSALDGVGDGEGVDGYKTGLHSGWRTTKINLLVDLNQTDRDGNTNLK
jgi:hypothetical protein